MTAETWYFLANKGDWVFETQQRCLVCRYSKEYREWEKVWGKATPCPVDANGDDDIAAITDELWQQDKQRRIDAAGELKKLPSNQAEGYPATGKPEDMEERERRLAAGKVEGMVVRTKG